MEKAWLEPRYRELYTDISQTMSTNIQLSEKVSKIIIAKGD